VESHIPIGYIGVVRNLEVFQFWCWLREPYQHAFEVREERVNIQPPDAMDVSECSGKEGFYVIIGFEDLMDVEELIPGSSKETLCLFGHGGGEVNLRPKARGREQHIPPRSTDVRHRDKRFVHREGIVVPLRLCEKVRDKDKDVFRQSVYGL